MQFEEFLGFISDGKFMEDGQVIVPWPSLNFPHFTAWMFSRDFVEQLQRRT